MKSNIVIKALLATFVFAMALPQANATTGTNIDPLTEINYGPPNGCQRHDAWSINIYVGKMRRLGRTLFRDNNESLVVEGHLFYGPAAKPELFDKKAVHISEMNNRIVNYTFNLGDDRRRVITAGKGKFHGYTDLTAFLFSGERVIAHLSGTARVTNPRKDSCRNREFDESPIPTTSVDWRTMRVFADRFLGDINRDGIIDFADFRLLEIYFGKGSNEVPQGQWKFYDTDQSGAIDFADFLPISSNFGRKNIRYEGYGG